MMVDVVDLSDESPPRSSLPTPEQLRQGVLAELQELDLTRVSLKVLRRSLERRFGLQEGSLDGEKDAIRAIATERVQQEATRQAEADAAAPPAKRRKESLLMADGAGAQPSSVLGAGEPIAKEKRKATPNSYQLFCNDNRASVTQDFEATRGVKPTFVESNKVLSERWKSMSTEEKTPYEAKAKQAKEEAANNPTAAVAVSARGKGGGRGKASVKKRGDTAEEHPTLTRADFLKAGTLLRCSLMSSAEEGGLGVAANELTNFELKPRLSKSDSVGWFQGAKFKLNIGGSQVTVQAQMNISVVGSKTWQDGEGLQQLKEALATVSAASDAKVPGEIVSEMGGDEAGAMAEAPSNSSSSSHPGSISGAPRAAQPVEGAKAESDAMDESAAEKDSGALIPDEARDQEAANPKLQPRDEVPTTETVTTSVPETGAVAEASGACEDVSASASEVLAQAGASLATDAATRPDGPGAAEAAQTDAAIGEVPTAAASGGA